MAGGGGTVLYLFHTVRTGSICIDCILSAHQAQAVFALIAFLVHIKLALIAFLVHIKHFVLVAVVCESSNSTWSHCESSSCAFCKSINILYFDFTLLLLYVLALSHLSLRQNFSEEKNKSNIPLTGIFARTFR